MVHPYKRGFTLIELLVVIAVIAVLAAILFPVFAQARAKTRQAVCLSHFKQIALSIQMYAQDYDETLIPEQNGRAYWADAHLWPQLVMPYIKNWQIFACPEDPNARESEYLGRLSFPANAEERQRDYARAYYSDFGYNSDYLSPYSKAIFRFAGVSLALLQQPAMTLLGTDSSESAPYNNLAGPGSFQVFPPTTTQWVVTGKDRSYGEVAPRHFDRATGAFADGHCKALTIGDLIRGSDVETMHITDPDAYLWDTD